MQSDDVSADALPPRFCTGCLACFRRLRSHPLASWGSGSQASRALISERETLTCLPGSFGVKGTAHRHLSPRFRCKRPLVPLERLLGVVSRDCGGGGAGVGAGVGDGMVRFRHQS